MWGLVGERQSRRCLLDRNKALKDHLRPAPVVDVSACAAAFCLWVVILVIFKLALLFTASSKVRSQLLFDWY